MLNYIKSLLSFWVPEKKVMIKMKVKKTKKSKKTKVIKTKV